MTAINVETPAALIRLALEGRLSKPALAALLSPESRVDFFRACAVIEHRLTDACSTSGDPCLASGCSCEGDACLNPLMREEDAYLRACGAEWAKLFADAANRGAWNHAPLP